MSRSKSSPKSPPLGAHVSVAGGLALAFERGREIGCDALQIFVKNANQWRAKPLAEADIATFAAARIAAGEPPLVAHAAYLINLCAVDPAILEKSRAGLADEVLRAGALGVGAVVVHPGAHLGAGEDAGLTAIAASLDEIAGRIAGAPAGRILIEATAGQGSVLGHRLEQLAAIRERARSGAALGFCLDTCHAYAAGYDLGSAAAVEDYLGEVDRLLGLDSIGCVHLNDSVGELGSHKDRHANLGEGRIALEGFRRLLAEPRLAHVPMILETPLGDDERGHARDLETLRSLLG